MKKALVTFLAVFAFCLQVAKAQTGYGIHINGTQITSANASNFTASGLTGTVSYNASTHVLTFDSVISSSSLRFLTNTTDITINFSGNCQFSGYIENTSSHKVTLQGQDATAQFTSKYMYAQNAGSDLELVNGIFHFNENMTEYYGLFGYGAENLTITNAEVYAGGTSCAVDEWNSITLNGCQIVAPVGAVVENGCIRLNGNHTANQVVHIVPITYGIQINNTEITTANAANFTTTGLTGTVTYDEVTRALTLNNVSATSLAFIDNTTDVTVNFSGNCLFSDVISNMSRHKVTFNGQTANAQLTAGYNVEAYLAGSDYEFANGIFRFNENKTTDLGLYGYGDENLTFTNAEAFVGGGFGEDGCAIDDWNSITFNGCEIVEPMGAVVEDGCVKLNGNEVANQVVHIAPIVEAIDIVRTTEFAIVPNPAKDETVLMLEPYSGTAVMQLFDTNGRILTTVMLPAQLENYRLNVSTLEAGTYFINVTANGTRQTATLLKK